MTADPTALAETLLPCRVYFVRPDGMMQYCGDNRHLPGCPAYLQPKIAEALRTHASTVAREARRKAFEEAASIARAYEGNPAETSWIADEIQSMSDASSAALQTGEEGS